MFNRFYAYLECIGVLIKLYNSPYPVGMLEEPDLVVVVYVHLLVLCQMVLTLYW